MSLTPLTLVRTPCAHLARLQTRSLSSKSPRAAKVLPSTPKRGPAIEKQLSAYLQRQHSSRRTNPPATPATMSFLLPGLRRGLMITSPLLLSTPLLAYQYRHSRSILCDSPDPLAKLGDLRSKYSQEAQTPVITQSGAANPRAVRQISMGSIFGVLGGLGVSVFSKPLAILIGLGVLLVQFIETRGIHIIPYSWLQRRFKATNVRSLLQDNVAFKLSFGLTFALAAFAEF